MEKILYFVHAVDTEGPLYESIHETFLMINSIFNLNIEPSKENLIKLQKKELNLNGQEELVFDFVKPERMCYKKNWNELEEMVIRITSEEYRSRYKDDFNKGWVYSWCTMDHIGFNGVNPRNRTYGYHNIFDFYKIENQNSTQQDDFQFHYHPLSLLKNANSCGTTFVSSSNIFEILVRKIIDRSWFPSVYRPGFHTERPDSNWFLEQWIPFDYGNQSIDTIDKQPDLSNGRFGDWRGALTEWGVYNPSHRDYRKPGSCKRYIARCLNIDTRLRNINEHELEKAFLQADSSGKSLVAVTNHDFREMSIDNEKVYNMLKLAQKKYPEVKIKFAKATEGIRAYLDLPKEYAKLSLYVEKMDNIAVLHIIAEGTYFGVQPFLALKTQESNYYWDNFDFFEKNHWTYTFDGQHTFRFEALEKIGVAMNSPYGITEIINYDVMTEKVYKTILNE